MSFKVDRYRISSKKMKQKVDILVFNPENIWIFDDHPAEESIDIDGDKEALTMLLHAYYILLNDPNVIIYFPKTAKYNSCLAGVLFRPELQFKKSNWFDIKSKIDKNHKISDYAYDYNYNTVEKLWKEYNKKSYNYKVNDSHLCREEILGNTVFYTISRYSLFDHIENLDCVLSNEYDSDEYGIYWYHGYYLYSQKSIIDRRKLDNELFYESMDRFGP